MSPKQRPTRKVLTTKQKSRSRKRANPDDEDSIIRQPRPAFRVFELEDEWHGRRRMRNISRCIDGAKFAPNAHGEISSLYQDALGKSRVKYFICTNLAGEVVHREEWLHISPEDAARDLLAIAKDATLYLELLLDRQPELCQRIATRKPDWPVMLDLTEKDWHRKLNETVSKLDLGKEISGYLVSARTADENVIRCWATAIFETLYQSRWDFKRAVEEPSEYSTTEGCPEWVRKTLSLPPFTKEDSRKWAKLGEEMLLQQNPNFLDSPDLSAKKRSWTHRAEKKSRTGKVTTRAIHREAFDDFAKEIKNLAPEQSLWLEAW
jgi:hypothetical protein